MGGDTPNIYPGLYYRDAPAAIEWLTKAFGFEKVMVVPGENGTVAHAELRYGPGIIMLGSAGNQPGSKSPLDVDGATCGIYIYVDDAELPAHYQRAKAAGASIYRELERKDYGGSSYSAHDPESHEWSFGSYVPGDPENA